MVRRRGRAAPRLMDIIQCSDGKPSLLAYRCLWPQLCARTLQRRLARLAQRKARRLNLAQQIARSRQSEQVQAWFSAQALLQETSRQFSTLERMQ